MTEKHLWSGRFAGALDPRRGPPEHLAPGENADEVVQADGRHEEGGVARVGPVDDAHADAGLVLEDGLVRPAAFRGAIRPCHPRHDEGAEERARIGRLLELASVGQGEVGAEAGTSARIAILLRSTQTFKNCSRSITWTATK